MDTGPVAGAPRVLGEMTGRGLAWGGFAGLACGVVAGLAVVLNPTGWGASLRLDSGSLVVAGLAACLGGVVGLLLGLVLGLVEGVLLGLWTAAHPRPRAARAAYRRRITGVVGVLSGAVVAVALVLAYRLGAPQALRGALPSVLFLALEVGLAAGAVAGQLLGWYAARAA